MELEEEEGSGAVMGHGGWANQGSNNPRGWGWQGPNESGSGSQSPSDQFDHRGSPAPGQWSRLRLEGDFNLFKLTDKMVTDLSILLHFTIP